MNEKESYNCMSFYVSEYGLKQLFCLDIDFMYILIFRGNIAIEHYICHNLHFPSNIQLRKCSFSCLSRLVCVF